MELRRLSPADEPFVERLAGSAFAEYSAGGAGRWTRSMVRDDRTRSFVAWDGARRAGFVVVDERLTGVWELLAIAVIPEHRGRGVGELLLRRAIRFTTERGGRDLWLTTGESNLEALSLFTRLGFRTVERLPRHYAGRYDGLRLKLTLSR